MSEPFRTDQQPHEHAGPWLDDARRILTLIENATQSATPGGPAPAAECAWCPLCQALGLARRSAPELLDRLAEVAAGLAATIRATGPAAPDSAPPQAGGPAERPAPPEPAQTVWIDITD